MSRYLFYSICLVNLIIFVGCGAPVPQPVSINVADVQQTPEQTVVAFYQALQDDDLTTALLLIDDTAQKQSDFQTHWFQLIEGGISEATVQNCTDTTCTVQAQTRTFTVEMVSKKNRWYLAKLPY